MRPQRLEMVGFSAFAERTVVDFEGAELFALTGPTGAGKTSVLDAILFALYGAVPRHGKQAVTAVVTQGLLEARVGLDFTVADAVYRVARVVRRDPKTGRASTTEARSGDGRRGDRLGSLRCDGRNRRTSRTQLRPVLSLRAASPRRVCPLPARQARRPPGPARGAARSRDLRKGGSTGDGAQGGGGGSGRRDRCPAHPDRRCGTRAPRAGGGAGHTAGGTGRNGRVVHQDARGPDRSPRRSRENSRRQAPAGRHARQAAAPSGLEELAQQLAEASTQLEAARSEQQMAVGRLEKAEAALLALPARAILERWRERRTELSDLEQLLEKAARFWRRQKSKRWKRRRPPRRRPQRARGGPAGTCRRSSPLRAGRRRGVPGVPSPHRRTLRRAATRRVGGGEARQRPDRRPGEEGGAHPRRRRGGQPVAPPSPGSRWRTS